MDAAEKMNHREHGEHRGRSDQDNLSVKGPLGITLLLCSSLVPASLEQTNILPNPGFVDGEGMPTGWSFQKEAGAEGECVPDASLARSGKRSLRFRKTNGRGYFTLDLVRRVPVQPGHEYEVRGYVHVADAAFGAQTYFVIRQYPKDSDEYVPPNIFSSHDQRVAIRCRQGEWSLRSTAFTARPSAAFVEVTLVVAWNPCTIYWDDLYVGTPLKPKIKLPRLEPERLVSTEEVYGRLGGRENATGEIKSINGQPSLLIEGKPVPPNLHLMCFWRPFSSYNGDFGRAGVRIHVCPIVLAPYLSDGTHLWKGEGDYGFGKADEVLLYALRADPGGYLIVDLCLLGSYPGWGDK